MKSTFALSIFDLSPKTRKQHYLQPLIGAALLSLWMLPTFAAGTPAGTTINNTAYGSFENPSNPGTVIDVDSNTVTLTVSEVAGIDVTAGTATEAPSGVANAGPGQGDNVISAEDVVYLTYRIANIGNDQTQFFLPGAPASVTNGAFDFAATGPIRIVGYNNGITTTLVNIPIPNAGAASGTFGALPNGGSVPVNGYIEVQVPIKAAAGLVPGTDQITVVLGNTPTATSQNVPYIASGQFSGNNDVFTQDNAGTNNGDLVGSPNPEREASDVLVVGLGVPNLDYGDATDTSVVTAQGDYQTVPGRGPSHVVDGVTFLGTGVDAENTAFSDGPAQDNGVVVNDGFTTTTLHTESFIVGQNYTLDVTTAGTGVLNAWIDFNRDGDFDDAGEQIATNATPSSNLVSLNVPIPFGAVAGNTYARFRYSSVNSLGPNSAASNGEVEDYAITLIGAAPDLKLVKRVTSIGGSAIATINNDPGDLNDDSPNWPVGYLQGAFTSTAEPSQTVDYTIYYLSDGNTPINNIRLCDLVPDNTTYVAGSLQMKPGTGAVVLLSDAADADAGESFGNTATPGAPCDRGTNTDGGILVRVPGSLPNAAGPGTPGSYGYIRFTVTVD
jgi:uncharacterized repeat protein (TIGR01451 family)